MSFKKNEKMHNADGTPYYIAPEVLEGNYDEKCDVWSCGVILYIMLCGYPPFNGETDDEILQAVKKGTFDFPKEEWGTVSQDAKDLINKMLTYEPTKRVSALDCLSQSWFVKHKEKALNDKKVAKSALANMKKFKKDRKLEQATIGFIVNQFISKDERKELAKQFAEWDSNGDGVLSKEEIVNGYKKAYGTVDENEIDNMMKSVDTDGNGVIDYNEFLACAVNRDKIMSKENLELAFKAFDTDGSGKISVDELMDIFCKGDKSHANKQVFEKMVKDADENGDGEISFSEFKTIMTNFFS
jgi:calcium-dependent protein kinase